MKPNPGGILSGEAIVNREQEIQSIWKALQGKSVVLISERRVGKTCVLRKMEENPRDDWTPILYLVEGKSHPIEFVGGLYERLLEEDIFKYKFHNLKKIYTKYADGQQIGSWKLPEIRENWKTLLDSMLQDIIDANKKVLLMFDELPLMVHRFIQPKECGPHVGMEFLDTLRGLRNKYEISKKIAFIFSGSIGIHLVIKNLKRNHGYNADPINNMAIVALSGMSEDGARLLCEKLSEGEGYKFDDKEKIFDYVCKSTDNLPFYIQHVFAFIEGSTKKIITKELVDQAITYLLNDEKDEGFFQHYMDRITTYYDVNIRDVALLILDKTCTKEGLLEESEIINIVNTNMEIDKETVKTAIDMLWRDHYFIRNIKDYNRVYKFRYSILQKWWKVNRG